MADQWGTTDLAERGETIPLDLPFGDGPCLADESAAQAPVVDLLPQRGGQDAESFGGLREREHLTDQLGVRRGDEEVLGGALWAAGWDVAAEVVALDGRLPVVVHGQSDEALRADGVGLDDFPDMDLGAGEFVHADNLDGIAYVVKGSAS
jgi:hypothetical protein